jgi:hypothetical protein
VDVLLESQRVECFMPSLMPSPKRLETELWVARLDAVSDLGDHDFAMPGYSTSARLLREVAPYTAV